VARSGSARADDDVVAGEMQAEPGPKSAEDALELGVGERRYDSTQWTPSPLAATTSSPTEARCATTSSSIVATRDGRSGISVVPSACRKPRVSAPRHPRRCCRRSPPARGRGLGLTGVRRETDAVLFTRAELEQQIAAAMAGLAAEELVLGSASTGAEQDLERATDLAREIAGRYGLSERLGRARLLAHDVDAYLGGTTALAPMAARTHEAFDEEIASLLAAGERAARAVLDVHRDALDGLTQRLLDDETLEGAALAELLAPVAAVTFGDRGPQS